MENTDSKLTDYFRYQVQLYRKMEKELFVKPNDSKTSNTMEIATVGLFAEAFCWLSKKKGAGIGVACNIIKTICKNKDFKKKIDIAKWILSEKNGFDLYPTEMNQLRFLIKEQIIDYIVNEVNESDMNIEINPQDIFGEDFLCNFDCASCCNENLCEKLKNKKIIFQHKTIYML
jgi:hypothetical protein